MSETRELPFAFFNIIPVTSLASSPVLLAMSVGEPQSLNALDIVRWSGFEECRVSGIPTQTAVYAPDASRCVR